MRPLFRAAQVAAMCLVGAACVSDFLGDSGEAELAKHEEALRRMAEANGWTPLDKASVTTLLADKTLHVEEKRPGGETGVDALDTWEIFFIGSPDSGRIFARIVGGNQSAEGADLSWDIVGEFETLRMKDNNVSLITTRDNVHYVLSYPGTNPSEGRDPNLVPRFIDLYFFSTSAGGLACISELVDPHIIPCSVVDTVPDWIRR